MRISVFFYIELDQRNIQLHIQPADFVPAPSGRVIGSRELSHGAWEPDPIFITCKNGEPDHEGRLPTRGAHLRAFRDHWPEGIRLPGFDDFGLCSPILDAVTTEG